MEELNAREVHNQLRAALERTLAERKEELQRLETVLWAFGKQRESLVTLIEIIEKALAEDDQAAQPQ